MLLTYPCKTRLPRFSVCSHVTVKCCSHPPMSGFSSAAEPGIVNGGARRVNERITATVHWFMAASISDDSASQGRGQRDQGWTFPAFRTEVECDRRHP